MLRKLCEELRFSGDESWKARIKIIFQFGQRESGRNWLRFYCMSSNFKLILSFFLNFALFGGLFFSMPVDHMSIFMMWVGQSIKRHVHSSILINIEEKKITNPWDFLMIGFTFEVIEKVSRPVDVVPFKVAWLSSSP